MKSIAFLVDPTTAHNDNHRRLPAAFNQAGWQTHCANHDDLRFDQQHWFAGERNLAEIDWIWPLGLGQQRTYLDRLQIVQRLSDADGPRTVAPPRATAELHGKAAWLPYLPPTTIAQDIETLSQAMSGGGRWVLKPNAGSFGRDVHVLDHPGALAAIVSERPNQFWLLQPYLDAIVDGEVRTLVAGKEIIGSYLRVPMGNTANLATGAKPEICQLNNEERRLVNDVHTKLLQHGVYFAAIDTVGGYLMEVNLANPGGLGTLADLTGEDPSGAVVAAIDAIATG